MRIARGISVTNTSKPISTAPAYDADATAFFTAASITDTTQKNAVNTLVLSLKSANIWTKMKALYPVVGGSASSHAVNLKQPGTFNLSFATGWTHSSTGMTPSNAYANTFLNSASHLSLNSTHISFYSRTNSNATEIEIGSQNSSTPIHYLLLEIRTSGNTYAIINTSNTSGTSFSDANSLGYYIGNRTASNVMNCFKNGNKSLNTSIASTFLNNSNIYIGALNNGITASNFTTKQCAFASIGDGLTDAEALSFYNAVQTYQTTLGRQV